MNISERGGASALEAINYLQPVVQDILSRGTEAEARDQFVTTQLAQLREMPSEELNLLGHRLMALIEVTEKMATVVAVVLTAREAEAPGPVPGIVS